MTKPIKRIHVQELEQNLSADNYVSPTNWELCQSTFLDDANFREIYNERLNAFGVDCLATS